MNMRNLAAIRNGKAGRCSSWDTSGRNGDWWIIPAGESRVLADIRGPGVITHIWMTQKTNYRECLLKITWDDAAAPSVLCPLGDFFGLGHGFVNSYQSLLFTASTGRNNQMDATCAQNCYAQMPFHKRAVVEMLNEGTTDHQQYFYVDYEQVDERDLKGLGFFHAEFRRACLFQGWAPEMFVNQVNQMDIPNLGREAWDNNYVILETQGRGHYLGCNLSVTNIQGSWWGEGDDMIWVDGYKWPPDLHGTGSEDFLSQGWGMQPNAFLRNGTSLHEKDTGGYQTSYVQNIENPVPFTKEIKVTIEHGHANHLCNEMASVAYWYAEEPTAAIAVPPVAKRLRVPKVDGKWFIPPALRWPGKPLVIDEAVLQKARQDFAEYQMMVYSRRMSERHSQFLETGWQASAICPLTDVTQAPYIGLGGAHGWSEVPAQMKYPIVQVHGLRGPQGLVYLARKVRVAAAGEWILHVGHDGGARVFVDGKPVAATGGTINPAPLTRTQARLALGAGEHEIVVALDRDGGLGWGIFVSFEQTGKEGAKSQPAEYPEPL